MSEIAVKAAALLLGPLYRQIEYLFQFRKNVNNLEKQSNDLQAFQTQVEADVNIAEGDSQKIKDHVRNWLAKAPDATAKAEKLKQKAQRVSCFSVWPRYQLSRKAKKVTLDVVELLRDGKEIVKSDVGDPAPLQRNYKNKDFMLSIAAESAFGQIMEALKNDTVSVIGLYGMGGVGKTTLAHEVGYKAKKEGLFDSVVMAVVSQNADLKSIQRQIAEALRLELKEEHETNRAAHLMGRLQKERRILIILDDVWNPLKMTDVGIPHGDDHKGCKILITTRRHHVCVSMGCQIRLSLKGLTEDEALALLKTSAGLNNDSFLSIEKKEVAEEVAKQCKGLPLALVIVGKALKEKTLDDWKEALRKLSNSCYVDVEDAEKEIYPTLKLSYDYLREESVRSTFLLCSLFPEDSGIPIEELTIIGWGSGLFDGIEYSTIQDARIKMKLIIKTLQKASLLMEVDDEDESVKLHDVVRDTALWIASKGENNFFVKTRAGLSEWPRRKGIEKYTAVSLMKNYMQEFRDGIICPNIKILFIDGSWEHKVNISNSFFKEMKALQVLRIERCNFLQQSLQFLTNLRALHMWFCNFDGSSAIGRLSKLEILIMHGNAAMTELPHEIGELTSLKLLEIVDCRKLRRIPLEVVSKLCNLEEFLVFDCSELDWVLKDDDGKDLEGKVNTDEGILRQLNLLSHLRRVSLQINVTRIPDNFRFPKQWSTFDITAAQDDFHSFENFPKGRTLKLGEMDDVSLNAFKELYPTVQYLQIRNSSNLQNVIPEIGTSDLCRLHLKDCESVESVFDLTHQYQDIVERNPMMMPLLSNLTHLELHSLDSLKYLWRGPRQDVITQESQSLEPFCLRQLKKVKISFCEKLEYVFPISIAKDLQKLEVLQIEWCDNLKQVFGRDEQESGVRGDGKDITLLQLWKVELTSLPNLIGFYEEEGDYHWTWPSLKELTLWECPKLSASFMTNLEENLMAVHQQLRYLTRGDIGELNKTKMWITPTRHSFQSLQKLEIGKQEGRQQLFVDELGGQRLQRLALHYVDDLKEIWKSSIHQISSTFPYLREITLKNCNDLESLFPTSSSFPVLLDITVIGCNNLKYLFSNIDTICLPKLEFLYVEGAAQLEHVFKHDSIDDDDGDVNMVIECHSIQRLQLINLPMLVSFCPRGYHVVLGGSTDTIMLKVEGCPKLTTNFSIDANKCVHAKARTDDDDDQRISTSSHVNDFYYNSYNMISNLSKYTA